MEEEEVEVPVTKEAPKEANKMETDEASSDATPPSSTDADVNMQDAKGAGDAPAAENGVPESGDKPVQMETEQKVFCYFCVSGSSFLPKLYPASVSFLMCINLLVMWRFN